MLRGEWKLEKAIEVAKRETWEMATEVATERAQKRIAMAMIQANKSVNEIVQFTGLIVDDVLKLMSE